MGDDLDVPPAFFLSRNDFADAIRHRRDVGSNWPWSTFWLRIAISHTLNDTCGPAIACLTSSVIADRPGTTSARPRPDMTTSISDCELTDATSRSQRHTAVWSCGSSVVRLNTTLYGFGCCICARTLSR